MFFVTTETEQIEINAGPVGFVAIAFVAVAVILLTLDMVRRIRRTRIRAEVTAMLNAEEASDKGSSATA